ncbi:hypothetical protein [Gordonia sp. NPDC003950]
MSSIPWSARIRGEHARIADGVYPLTPPRPKRRKKRYPVVPDDGAPPPF